MFKTVTAAAAAELIRNGVVQVIDVREPAEFAGGHLPGSRLIPLATFRASPGAALAELSDRPVLFVCAAGVRSEAAARLAATQGQATVYNLSGGTRAWARAGLSLENEPVLGATG